MTIKEQLQNVPKTSYGAISISKKPESKFYELRRDIIAHTLFLPDSSKISERCHCILNDITEWPNCQCGCNQPVKKIFSKYLPAHGNRSKQVQEKKRQTFQTKYGVDNCSQIESIKEQKCQTFQKHFGADHYMQSESGYEDFKTKMKEHIGYENPFAHPEVKEKNRQNWLSKKDEIIKKRNQTRKASFIKKLTDGRLNGIVEPLFDCTEYTYCDQEYKFKCCKCSSIFFANLDDGNVPRCFTCYPRLSEGGTSKVEQEIRDYVGSLVPIKTTSDRKLIDPLELDIVVPERKIAIEVNGLYWHSEITGEKNGSYHLYKTEQCEAAGYRLIHIFEDEWHTKQEIVKNRLKHLFGIYDRTVGARKCSIQEIPSPQSNEFLDKYHIQGSCNASIQLGAFYQDELIGVMTFCKERFRKSNGWELLRFATIAGTSTPGLASRLLSHFKKNYEWTQIISYADRRWSNGNVYEKLGFNFISKCAPSYWYTNDYVKRHYRFNFRKSTLKEKLDVYDISLTEWENMQNNGWDRIWDCGNLVYRMSKDKEGKRK